jgi:hypothetical protein
VKVGKRSPHDPRRHRPDIGAVSRQTLKTALAIRSVFPGQQQYLRMQSCATMQTIMTHIVLTLRWRSGKRSQDRWGFLVVIGDGANSENFRSARRLTIEATMKL